MTPQTYTVAQVARAIRIEPNTVKAWIQRGHISFDIAPQGAGLARPLGRPECERLAIMAALTRLGINARDAWHTAWAYFQVADAALAGEQQRLPGGLFANGRTILACYPDEAFGYVFSVERPEDWKKLAFPVGLSTSSKAAGSFIDVNKVLGELSYQLGLPASDLAAEV